MAEIVYNLIEQHSKEGMPLGRHVEHDPRSREFAFTTAAPVPLETKRHRRYGGPLDQGDVGSCTGNAVAGALNTMPLHVIDEPLLKEEKAVEIYSLATQLDGFAGAYPPQDTGSSGLAAAKAAKQLGFLSEYRHAFSLDDALQALMVAPVVTGINWYEGFDNPEKGWVKKEGQIRGGHEIEVLAYVAGRTPYVWLENSWGKSWGVGGRFRMSTAVWGELLDEQGDVTILVR